MATLVPSPTYPIPGQLISITFGSQATGTTRIQVNAVSAPVGSAIRRRIDDAKGRTVVDVANFPADVPWSFTADKGGVYTFQVVELAEQPASGAQFQRDPAGAPDPTITATTNLALYVGEKLTMKVGDQPHQADLVVYVWNANVRQTTIPVHGVATPILENPKSPAAASAIEDATLVGLVAGLIDQTVAAVIGNFVSDFGSIATVYNAHMANATAHDNTDSLHAIGGGYSATNIKSAVVAINELRRKLGEHVVSLTVPAPDPEDPPLDTHGAIDGTTVFQSTGAQDNRASQYYALADISVRLAEHKALGAPVHNSADAASAPTIGPLTTIMARYITALRLTSPATPPARNPGAATLEQFGGFSA